MSAKSIYELPTPVLLLDWPAAKRNIDCAAALVADTQAKLRPHFKNHKCIPLAKEQMAAGGCVGFTAATLHEADVLLQAGMDVLLANQLVGDAAIQRLVGLAAGRPLRGIVDDLENAGAIGAAAAAVGNDIGVLVEIETGNERCGVAPGAPTLEFVRRLLEIPGIRFDGLHAYHGHAVGTVDPETREALARSTMQAAIETRRLIEGDGIACDILSAAGSSTMHVVADMAGVDELQAGTYVTMDCGYKPRAPMFDIALTVLSTILHAEPDRFVLDVGVKGVGHEYGVPQIQGHANCEVLKFGAEEHTRVTAPGNTLAVGARVHVIPSHACSTCNLYEQIVVHDGDAILDVWQVSARGYPLVPDA